jgi:hypothetical protein
MDRKELLTRIGGLRPELDRLRIKSLALFGSAARDEARADSDIDLLAEFFETPDIFEFIRAKQRLEELLGRRVDLVTVGALDRRLRESVLKEAIRAA